MRNRILSGQPIRRRQNQVPRPSAARIDPLGTVLAGPLIDRRIARDLAACVAIEHRLAFARSFTFTATMAYAASLSGGVCVPEVPQSVLLTVLHEPANIAAMQLGAGLAGVPLEEAAYLLGCIYTSVLPADFRASHGVFYTPPEIVRYVLDMAERAGVDWLVARCLDPSAGGGAFLIEMIRRIRAALEGTEPALVVSQIAARVRGYDLDPFGVWLAQTVVHLAVRDLEHATGRLVPAVVELRNSLDIAPVDHAAFDLVASNVPFGRITLPPEQRAIYARSTYGHANLYGLFTDAAMRYAKSDGVVAYVMPTSMLSGLYFQALRGLIVKEAPPCELTFVTERSGVFDDALQETMLVTYCMGRRSRSAAVNFLSIDDKSCCTVTSAGRFPLPSVGTAPWLLPRDPAHAKIAHQLGRMADRLATYGYSVSTGPLVWNRYKTQFRARRAAGALPVVWAEAVTSDCRFLWRADKRNHAPWFVVRPGKDDWLIIDHTCILLQRTTAKEQDRRLIAAVMPESFVRQHRGVIVENHLNMIRCRSVVPVVQPAVIAAVLNSRAADSAFRCISGSVAVSAFELEALPLPPLSTMRQIATLLDREASVEEIEHVIAEAYGLADAATAA
jgi:adenine-specific DNA-methyltransferase